LWQVYWERRGTSCAWPPSIYQAIRLPPSSTALERPTSAKTVSVENRSFTQILAITPGVALNHRESSFSKRRAGSTRAASTTQTMTARCAPTRVIDWNLFASWELAHWAGSKSLRLEGQVFKLLNRRTALVVDQRDIPSDGRVGFGTPLARQQPLRITLGGTAQH
jgi:hypothetical protein